jgi:hypothetical protein
MEMLCSFPTITEENGAKARWPLVYISSIMKLLSNVSHTRKICGVIKSIWALIEEFKSDTAKIGSGMGWQTIVRADIS